MSSPEKERETQVYMAKLAEQAERYEEMVECMKKVAKLDLELTVEERNLLSVGYKNVIGARRASWRIMSSIEQKEESKGNEHNVKLIKGYRQKVEEELSKICNDILSIIDKHLIPSSTSGEATVFYYKMKGDYYRYLAEFKTDQDRKEVTTQKMAAELVNSATSEKLSEMDWMKNIQICELVARDHRQARDVIKAIKKRLGSKHANSQLYAVMLLEMLMNNIGEHIHTQVIDTGLLPSLVKIVKKKSDLPVRERIFLLLDATQTSLGGASGKFPQYYTAYYDLVSAGLEFPQRPHLVPPNPSSQSTKSNLPNGELASSIPEGFAPQAEPHIVPQSSIIQKASNALEVLREVLDAVDGQRPEAAKDEFTLDLVEQCSFQKQKVMHLVMTSRDEKAVSRAIELNEQLQKVLARHDALLSCKPTSTVNHLNQDQAEEEEEAEQLFRRLRKGKACVRPEDEEQSAERPHLGLLGSSQPGERLNRPLIRPLCLEPPQESNGHLPPVAIPPPPAKHIEREKYFQETKMDGSGLAGHVRGLSLHSRNASSSRSGSMDFSD